MRISEKDKKNESLIPPESIFFIIFTILSSLKLKLSVGLIPLEAKMYTGSTSFESCYFYG